MIDAAQTWRNPNREETYHLKQIPGVQGNLQEATSLTFYDPQPTNNDDHRRKAVYARSAYRNEAEFQLDRLMRVQPALQKNRINRLIEKIKP